MYDGNSSKSSKVISSYSWSQTDPFCAAGLDLIGYSMWIVLPTDRSIREVSETGSLTGLTLLLDAGQDEYVPGSQLPGFQVMFSR